MTDLVYILGSASQKNNLELQYSIASVQRYMTGVKDIYIIGEPPGFSQYYRHIPYPDCGKNKQDNIRQKIEHACRTKGISDPFLLMNDDFIIKNPVEAGSIPYYYNTNLTRMWKAKRKAGHYKTAIHNTLIALSEKDLPIRHYDIHTPILYFKEEFISIMSSNNWNQMHGYIIKSLYCNTVGVTAVHYPDPKVVTYYSEPADIENEIKDWFMFSFDDNSLSEGMLKYLSKEFPEVKKDLCIVK